MEISLPGEQVPPLPKLSNRNRKNNQKNKPNGFICFANAQKKALSLQYKIRGASMLVELCDPLWRKLSPDEKKQWTQRAKEEYARTTGKKPGDPALRMDCNRKLITERQYEEKAQIDRRNHERRFVREELQRCDKVIDKVFYIVDALSIVEYLDGEHVPCEVGVIKCTIRDGIIEHYHFFPDPGPLRAGHFAEALERCEKEHEIKPKDFPLASNDYERDVSKLVNLMNLQCPKSPFIFAPSSDAKKTESCLEWLGFRVNQEFKPKVMELECFIEELISFTKNMPPTFAQIRRLLSETKFDFIRGNRCDFHSQTDKIACSIGNVRKYLYFMCEILFDYFDFEIVGGRHFPQGYDKSWAASQPSFSATSSELDERHDFNDTSSVASSFSIGSYQQNRYMEQPRKPHESSLSTKKKEGMLDQVTNMSLCQPNSFITPVDSFGANPPLKDPPRRPHSSPSFDKEQVQSYKSGNVSSMEGFYTGVNSFSKSTSCRSVSSAASVGRGTAIPQPTSSQNYNHQQQLPRQQSVINQPSQNTSYQEYNTSSSEPTSLSLRTESIVPSSLCLSRGRGMSLAPRSPGASSAVFTLKCGSTPDNSLPGVRSTLDSSTSVPSYGRGRGRAALSSMHMPIVMPRRPNSTVSKKIRGK